VVLDSQIRKTVRCGSCNFRFKVVPRKQASDAEIQQWLEEEERMMEEAFAGHEVEQTPPSGQTMVLDASDSEVGAPTPKEARELPPFPRTKPGEEKSE
jgi:hypothetical protein